MVVLLLVDIGVRVAGVGVWESRSGRVGMGESEWGVGIRESKGESQNMGIKMWDFEYKI